MNQPGVTSLHGRPLCSFWLGEHWFGVDTQSVREVSSQAACAPIPLAPAAVRGYVNLRGQLHLALDMRRLLGMPAAEPGAETHLIVFKATAGEAFAVFVDRIGPILEVHESQIDRTQGNDRGEVFSAAPGPRSAGLIAGMAKLDAGLMTIVDPRRILPAISQGTNLTQGGSSASRAFDREETSR